jgi:hypothetical protein
MAMGCVNVYSADKLLINCHSLGLGPVGLGCVAEACVCVCGADGLHTVHGGQKQQVTSGTVCLIPGQAGKHSQVCDAGVTLRHRRCRAAPVLGSSTRPGRQEVTGAAASSQECKAVGFGGRGQQQASEHCSTRKMICC